MSEKVKRVKADLYKLSNPHDPKFDQSDELRPERDASKKLKGTKKTKNAGKMKPSSKGW